MSDTGNGFESIRRSQFIHNKSGGIFFANKRTNLQPRIMLSNIVLNRIARCGKAGLEKLEERLLRYMKNIKIP